MDAKQSKVLPVEMGPGGIQDGFLGQEYQFKLLDLFAHRSVECGLKFESYTELANAGKFDDVTLKIIENDGTSKFIFGQAKHRKTSENLKFATLTTNKDFQISYYFDSLLAIEKHYENIESVQLITNNYVDDGPYKKQENGLVKLPFNKHLSLFLIEDTSEDFIYQNIGKRFRFPGKEFPTEHQVVVEVLRYDFIAKELVDVLLGNKANSKYSHQNQKFLFGKIFDVSKMQFREEVLDGSDSSLAGFRSAFEHAFKEVANKKGLSKWSKNCWNYWKQQSIEEKLKMIIKSPDADKDQEEFDCNLNRFIEKFVLVTSLETKHIENSIEQGLREVLKLKDVSSHYKVLTNSVKDWFTGPNKAYPLTKEIYSGFFDISEMDFQKKIMMNVKSNLFSDFFLEFKDEIPDIQNFLEASDDQQPRILHIITPASEESFTTMKIYSMLSSTSQDTFVMLRTSLAEETIEQGINVFKSQDCCKLLVLQVDLGKSVAQQMQSQLEAINDPSKRIILISDVTLKFQNTQVVNIFNVFLTDLTDKSLAEVLNIKVEFQNYSTTWADLLDKELFSKTLLADLLNLKSIAENIQVSKDFDRDLYVSRTFICKNILKPEVLKECGNDAFVYSKLDFESKFKSNPDNVVHWVENSLEGMKWIKSSNDISALLNYIDDGKAEEVRENSLVTQFARVMILVDVAGMGKSTVLNYLAQQLKKTQTNKWIVKIDLNDYTIELDEVEPEELETPENAIEFLIEKIFKLDTEFEKTLFKQSCEATGNVILLFDGFDEVASYYKDEITKLIETLQGTSVEKIFIATRPEWAEYLEEHFKQIKHSLLALSKEDQENYLHNFMKKTGCSNEELGKITEGILESMSKTLSDKDYKFTGVPLITKLVGEFLESEVCEYLETSGDLDDFISKLKSESFNLNTLYQHFVDKSLMVYFKDKLKMDPTNARIKKKIEKDKKEILENYQKLAVQEILKTDLLKHLPSADAKKLGDGELEVLIQVGLISKDRKYVHQTYGEFCFSKYLDEHFDDEDCSKFIFEVALVDRSYKIIRSFINFWISEKNGANSFEIYQEKLLASSRGKGSQNEDDETPFHVAGREGNENIFWFLYSSLTKTERFESEKNEIQAYLMKKSKHNYTAFAHYFRYCDDNLNILNQIKKDFGLDLIRKIFTINMYYEEEKLLQTICISGKNILKVLNSLLKIFSDDFNSLRKILLLTNEDGQSFLHVAFYHLSNEILLNLFDELNSLKSILGQDFIDEIILLRSRIYGVFLSSYSGSEHFNTNFLIQFLDKLKLLCGEETVKQFFLVRNKNSHNTLLHWFCEEVEDFNLIQVIQWINLEFGKDFLVKLFELKDKRNRTIFHSLLRCEITSEQSNFGSQFLSILKFLKDDMNFDKEFLLNEILFNKDKGGKNVFSNLFKKSQVREFYFNFITFLVQDLNLTHEEFKIYLIKNKFTLFWISQIEEKSIRDEILKLFNEKFGNIFLSDNFYSSKILQGICKNYSRDSIGIKNYLNFIEEQNDFDFLKNYVLLKNSKNQTIFFHFQKNLSDLIDMLDWLVSKFGNDQNFLKNFLLQVDENRNSFFMFVLKKCDVRWIHDYFAETLYFLIENFDQNFTKNFLLLKNNENEFFLNIVCERSDKDSSNILNLLLKNLKSEQEFFNTLINNKLKKNKKVKNWMKKKLKFDLARNSDDLGESSESDVDESSDYSSSNSNSDTNDSTDS